MIAKFMTAVILFFSLFFLLRNIIQSKAKKILKILCIIFLLIHSAIFSYSTYEILKAGIKFITNLNPQLFNLKCDDLNEINCTNTKGCYVGGHCGSFNCSDTPDSLMVSCFFSSKNDVIKAAIRLVVLASIPFLVFTVLYSKIKKTAFSKLNRLSNWVITLFLSSPVIFTIIFLIKKLSMKDM